jgi:hypothetical protein
MTDLDDCPSWARTFSVSISTTGVTAVAPVASASGNKIRINARWKFGSTNAYSILLPDFSDVHSHLPVVCPTIKTK